MVSIQSGSRHVTPSVLVSRKAGAKLVCQIIITFVITVPSIIENFVQLNRRIPYAYRIEMINTEIQQLLKELTEVEQKSAKRKIDLQAQMRENETSIRETFETREKFGKDIIEKGVDSITGKIPAEKFVRCHNNKLSYISI